MSKGEMTRQRIIEMAAPLFNQRGFAGCSMQDILEATGLQKGGVYRHFSSKEELAAEAFRYSLSQSLKLKAPATDKGQGSIQRLYEVIAQFVEKPSPTPGGCPIMNTAIDADDGNPVLRKLAQEGLMEWRDRISLIVRQGIARKEIQPGVKPRALANTIIATLEGALMISRLEGSRTALLDAREMLEGIVARVAESKA